jgi:hypothetical protein
LATPNDTILIPGNWTYPDRNLNPAEHEIVLGSSEDLVDLNFGWDYQFLPEPLLPYSYICTINQDAFGRMGPGTDYPEEFIGAEGEIFEVLARTEIGIPLWYYGKHESGKEGWMSEVVLDCEEIDPEQLFIREAPPIPEPEETEEPLVCKRDLNQQDCIASGGTWYKPVTHVGDPYCVCPED